MVPHSGTSYSRKYSFTTGCSLYDKLFPRAHVGYPYLFCNYIGKLSGGITERDSLSF